MELNSEMTSTVHGQRLLPSLVDHLAKHDPDQVLFSIAKTGYPVEGFTDVTAHVFARAVNRCCHWIEEHLGRCTNFPTLTYMGPQDLVYGVLLLASIKTGYKLLLTSPRNTLAAQLSLLGATDCNIFLLPARFSLPIVQEMLDGRAMRILETPDLQHWLAGGDEKVFPYTKSFFSAYNDPVVVLHTSGSTGLPKPITQTHATWAALDAQNDLPRLGHKPVYPSTLKGDRAYMAFPLFHAAGVLLLLPAAIFCEYTPVLGPWPPSANVVNSLHVHANVRVSIMAPTLLIDLTRDPEYLKNLGRLRMIAFGGGPLPIAIGKLASTKTRLQSILGTTEAGILPIEDSVAEDWEYMQISPVLGAEYRHVSGELYEQVIVRNEELKRFQSIFGTFPHLQEWSMKDMYSKHPRKDNLWRYRGRTDDIVVFATGEKLNPLAMEDVISSHPRVGAVVIAGAGQFQASLIVEPVVQPRDAVEAQSLLIDVWDAVMEANKHAPSHAKLHRDMILFTKREKPMLKAGKGTVQRKLTLDLYAEELNQLYKTREVAAVGHAGLGSTLRDSTPAAVERILSETMGVDLRAVDPDTNLFELGLDSLQVLIAARELSTLATRGNGHNITPRVLYENPTVRTLADCVSSLVDGDVPRPKSGSGRPSMEALYNQIRDALPISARDVQPKVGSEVVILTGSTGSIGSYTLDALLQNHSVGLIYCLNRGPNGRERQTASQQAKGLSCSLDMVQFLEVKYGDPYLGLSLPTYKQLLQQVSTVILAAWQVDFNLDVYSFTKHLKAVRSFVDFATQSRHGTRLFFVSSVGAVGNYSQITNSSTGVPEQIFNDWAVSQNAGYGQSKLIAERVLDLASREAGIPVTICRLGQISGPTTAAGIWPVQEWLPSLIASSKHLGKLPISLGDMETVNWVPVDKAANSIVELAIENNGIVSPGLELMHNEAKVYHLVNPHQTAWSHLVSFVQEYLNASVGSSIEVVSLKEWVRSLQQSSVSIQDVSQNPAVKILEFYESLDSADAVPTHLRTDISVHYSPTLSNLGPVTGSLMENWLRQWSF